MFNTRSEPLRRQILWQTEAPGRLVSRMAEGALPEDRAEPVHLGKQLRSHQYRIGLGSRFAMIWVEAKIKLERFPRFRNMVGGTGEAQGDNNRSDAQVRDLALPRKVN